VPLPSRPDIKLTVAVCVALVLGACTSSALPGVPDDPSVNRPTNSAPLGIGGAPSPSRRPAPHATPTPHRPPGVFTMAFAGDVHFSGRVGTRLATNPATVFAQAARGLRRADFTMVNLETAITTGGQQQNKEFTFRAPPSAFDAMRDAGIDLATMANNHGADYGSTGLRDSLRAMKAKHFPVVGVGADADAAFAPYTTTLNGVRVAIFAADQVHDETTLSLFSAGPDTAGVANAYDARLVDEVRAARRHGYVVVVYVHWGIEYQTCPSGDQTTLAGQLTAAGASAVIGTHAHVLQGAGWQHNGSYVAYGLGNYLWWLSFGNNQDDNGVLTLTFHRGKVTRAQFAASHLDDRGVPMPATGAEKQRIDAEWNSDRQCTDLSARPPK
jgi:poly-gamma-glutamate synthesis protein (capsule biosynthesis protein)